MRLSEALNRLTREEWNVAYFLGLEEMFCCGRGYTLAEQVARGVARLAAAGYSFDRSRGAPAGSPILGKRIQHQGEHGSACREITDGSFDTIGRAREALGWISAHAPAVDTDWVETLLSVYDRVHSGAPWAATARSPHSPYPLPST